MIRKEYEEFSQKHKISKERLEILEQEKTATIRMRRRGELTLKDYKKEMKTIKNDIIAAKADSEFTLVDKNQLRVLLGQAELFLTNLEPLYNGFNTANKQRFAHFIFPEGVTYQDGKIRTHKKALMFELIEAIEQDLHCQKNTLRAKGFEPLT